MSLRFECRYRHWYWLTDRRNGFTVYIRGPFWWVVWQETTDER